ncbi:Nitric oxide synthase-interacting protein [Intoshia linei]|uniref:Nitric oxide synthase-interacting protein n=1 Tax=Intoshia linei TaxID=1819745 RepID=A0A177BAM7_9BILA|nr:Nitric oxide synthase-interacting protein [Intoshia linei]
MTKHGKNATASTHYRYHELKKDCRDGKYGTQKVRLSKDSIKSFDCCSLTLQPCKFALVSPDGDVFDKESIIEFILQRKKVIKKELDVYKKNLKYYNAWKRDQEVNKPLPKIHNPDESTSNMHGEERKKLNNFWVVTAKDNVKVVNMPIKPNTKVLNPISNKPLKFKDLLPIEFVESPNSHTCSLAKKKYVCAATGDELSNNVACAIFKTSGKVITLKYAMQVFKTDKSDPFNNKPLQKDDLIELKRGSSGFVHEKTNLLAIKINPIIN